MTEILSKKKRVAVFIPVFGIPSEIWMVRQCLGFKHIEPIIICWEFFEGNNPTTYGLECHKLATPWEKKANVYQKLTSKLGFNDALLPCRQERQEIDNLLTKLRIDSILCHFAWSGVRVAGAIGNKYPTIWHVHGRDVSSSFNRKSYLAAFKKYLPLASKIVAVGSFQLDFLKNIGLRMGQGVLIPCGAPLDHFVPRNLNTSNKSEVIRIISIGRISHEKGTLETIRAFKIVLSKIPGAELILVGDGEVRPEAEKLARQLNVADHVYFAGVLSSRQVAEYLATADIFTLHSMPYNGWIEGFGVSVTEAAASGIPLVVSEFGGIIDQVKDGYNGILFPPGDVSAQAEAIIRMSRNRDLRLKMGNIAHEYSKEFDSRAQIAKLEKLILDTT